MYHTATFPGELPLSLWDGLSNAKPIPRKSLPRMPSPVAMGFALLNPSYRPCGFAGTAASTEAKASSPLPSRRDRSSQVKLSARGPMRSTGRRDARRLIRQHFARRGPRDRPLCAPASHPIGAYRICTYCMRAPAPPVKLCRGNGLTGGNDFSMVRRGAANLSPSGKPARIYRQVVLSLYKHAIFRTRS